MGVYGRVPTDARRIAGDVESPELLCGAQHHTVDRLGHGDIDDLGDACIAELAGDAAERFPVEVPEHDSRPFGDEPARHSAPMPDAPPVTTPTRPRSLSPIRPPQDNMRGERLRQNLSPRKLRAREENS